MTGSTPAPTASHGRAAARVVAALTAALGGAVVVGVVLSVVVPTLASATTRTESRALDVRGVSQLDLEVAATSFTVRFGDVDAATLDLRGVGGGDWTFSREGERLRVGSPPLGLHGWLPGRGGTATLTLPRSLETADLDATLTLGAGGAVIDGAFDRLELSVSAGRVSAAGSARELAVELSAGEAVLDVADVASARVDVAAGQIRGGLTGTAPDDIRVSVSAGSLSLALPDTTYAVTSDLGAGGFDNGLRAAATSSHRVHVEVAAGDARLTAR